MKIGNVAGALSSSLGLGSSVVSGLNSIEATSAATALSVLTAYEQRVRVMDINDNVHVQRNI